MIGINRSHLIAKLRVNLKCSITIVFRPLQRDYSLIIEIATPGNIS